MPISLETAVANYLSGSQPSITAVASQPTQTRAHVLAQMPRPMFPLTKGLRRVTGPTAVNDNPPPEMAKTPADVAVAQLIRFEQFEADWDGAGAARPIAATLKDARAFIRALTPESVVPRATLHADGHAILFVRETDVYGEIEFLGNGKIGFYVRRGNDQWSDEITFDNKLLPYGLSQIGFAL